MIKGKLLWEDALSTIVGKIDLQVHDELELELDSFFIVLINIRFGS